VRQTVPVADFLYADTSCSIVEFLPIFTPIHFLNRVFSAGT
jgi:hypothetical protein